MPAHRRRSHHLVRDALISLALCLVLVAAVRFVALTEQAREAQDLRARVTETVAALRTALEAEINTNVFLANGLAAHVIAVPDLEETRTTAALRTLYRLGQHLRNVGIAPGNRITHIYPLKGNEAAIGLFYPDVPAQWPSVKRAIERRETVLGGPFALVQGGNGLISRTPVFLDNGDYWGILSLVLDADSLFGAVGLAPRRGDIRFAMKGRDGQGPDGAMIMGDPTLFTGDAVRVPVAVPGGHWLLAAAPVGGWKTGGGLVLVMELAAVAVSAGLAVLLFLFLRKGVRLEASEQRTRAFLETTRDGVIVIGADGIIREFNDGAGAMLGYAPTEVIGLSVNSLMFPDVATHHDGYVRNAKVTAAHTMGGRRDIVARRKDGTAVPVEITVSETLYGGENLHVGVLRDITERKALEAKLRRLADTDGLTGLLNRRAFMAATARAFHLARRHGRPLGLLLIDADHFKKINDSHGHPAGDRVLVALAGLASSCLRSSDRLGRIGGEEFAVLLPETDETGAIAMAERLLAAIRAARIEIDGTATLSFTVSIGVAVMTSGMEDHEALVQRADQALYAAKSGGRDRWAAAP
ncbi:diguanylate cyclase [Roseospira navarrensis]|uniref:diguanylate cyclase n=1 Tax=Roseospira navarrensis TaxID=140058 RepID=A0A7X1ZBX4_9PROT|nr:diguanylate cyclase [Roseospira navarrensis]MQX35713.1 diguanylate cyclase [Roseospira navarrensis]